MSRNLLPLLLLTTACAPPNRGENSAICGITMLASATRIIEQVTLPHMALTEPPDELKSGVVPARVVGFGTSPASTGQGDDGRISVAFQGEGFPTEPGFGVALIDDSSEVFRGILIWDKEPPPRDYPSIGTISDPNIVMPLIGVRLNWASVNSDRCPIFANLDTLEAARQ